MATNEDKRTKRLKEFDLKEPNFSLESQIKKIKLFSSPVAYRSFPKPV